MGWVCGFSLGWQFIGSPIFEWIIKIADKNVSAPEMDTGSLVTVLFALLGLGGMRTFEKYKNSEGNR